MLKVKVLPVFYGDAIRIIYGQSALSNVLIDSGPKRSYYKGELKKEIEDVDSVDLVILTHVDDDHIGGILKYYQDPKRKDAVFKKVWFNSGSIIPPILNGQNDEIRIEDSSRTTMSVKAGITLESCLRESGAWEEKVFVAGDVVELENATFKFLSPTFADLTSLKNKWKKETDEFTKMTKSADYSQPISLLAQQPFEEKGSMQNKSSIALLFEYDGSRLLMLGDAFPSIVVKGLQELGFSKENKLKLDLVKLSHHGSKYGISADLLEIIDCQHFIISSDGTKGNPTKQCLAKIISYSPVPVNFYFNYSNSIIRNIFLDNEISLYNFKIFYLDEASDPYTISIK